jgi:hypothetical protein
VLARSSQLVLLPQRDDRPAGAKLMINLPAYSGGTLLAFIFADLLLLILFFVAIGPVFITGRDVYGRPLEVVSRVAQVFVALLLVLCVCYFALQAVIFYRFLPYYVDPGITVVERVTAKTVVESSGGAPIAYWITTETHRFGVTPEIYEALGRGDTVEARFRAADDTLYEIHILRYANGQPVQRGQDPSPSPGR